MRSTPHRTLAPRWRLLALLAAVGLLVGACGNADDDDTATGDTTETTAAPDDADEGDGAGDESDAGDTGEFQPIEGVPGVTDEEIQFAVMGTGPSNPAGYCLLECFQAGVEARLEYQNSLGGVHGRDLVISRVEDDEVGNTQVKLLELVEADDVFGIFAAPLLYAGYGDVGQTDVPMYTTFPASVDADGHDNIYVAGGTRCVDCPTPATTHAVTLVGASKVASLGFGVSQASKDCVSRTEEEINQYGPGAGVEFVYKNDELAFGFPNGVGPEVTAMKDAGVDYISTCIDQTSALTLEQELQRQGMDDVVVQLPQGYGDDEFLSSNAGVLEGDILSLPYRPAEADAEGTMVSTMVEQLEAKGQLNDYAIQGWMGAELAITGLLAAGPDFDQAAVVEATNQITDFTAGGLLRPVDWTTAHDAPGPDDSDEDCFSYLVVGSDGELELQGDVDEPFFCWDLPLEEYEEPEARS